MDETKHPTAQKRVRLLDREMAVRRIFNIVVTYPNLL
jgi:hypothetical protein